MFCKSKLAHSAPQSALPLSYHPFLLNRQMLAKPGPHPNSAYDCYYRHSGTRAVPKHVISDSRNLKKVKNENKMFERLPNFSLRKGKCDETKVAD
jgi:hypothetical protein